MRWLFLLAFPAYAQYTLYTVGVTTKDYVVGAKLPPSGLFVKAADTWRHAGFNLPIVSALDYDPRDPSTLFLAAGNGLIRVTEKGEKWKILTGSDVTELLDLSVDADDLYFSHTRGVHVSHDRGATWQDLSTGLRRKYTGAIRVDRRKRGVLVIGNEQGIFRSEDGGASWRLAGASGYQVLRVEQSPHDPCFWLAATQGGGLYASTDCAATFDSNGNLAVGQNLYDIAFDPASPERIAVAGWGPGVAVSHDRGKRWELRNAGLSKPEAWTVAFDPAKPGRLYTSIHEDALYASDDLGRSWRKDGLPGSAVYRMKFVPERPR
jgi:hypothetical protein